MLLQVSVYLTIHIYAHNVNMLLQVSILPHNTHICAQRQHVITSKYFTSQYTYMRTTSTCYYKSVFYQYQPLCVYVSCIYYSNRQCNLLQGKVFMLYTCVYQPSLTLKWSNIHVYKPKQTSVKLAIHILHSCILYIILMLLTYVSCIWSSIVGRNKKGHSCM